MEETADPISALSNLAPSLSAVATGISALAAVASAYLAWQIFRRGSREKIVLGIVSATHDFTTALQDQAFKVKDLRAAPHNSRTILHDEFSRAKKASSELELWAAMLPKREREGILWISTVGYCLLCDSYQADDPAFYMSTEDRREIGELDLLEPLPGISEEEWDHLLSEHEYQMILGVRDFGDAGGLWSKLEQDIRERVRYHPELVHIPKKSDEYFSANGDVLDFFCSIARQHIAEWAKKKL